MLKINQWQETTISRTIYKWFSTTFKKQKCSQNLSIVSMGNLAFIVKNEQNIKIFTSNVLAVLDVFSLTKIKLTN